MPFGLTQGIQAQAQGSAFSPLQDADLGSLWDFTDPNHMVKGGYRLDDPAQYFFADGIPNGVGSFPFWVAGWVRSGGASGTLMVFHGGDNNEFGIRSGSGTLGAYADNGSVGEASVASPVSGNVWYPFVALFESPTSRSIHTSAGSDTDTANITGVTPAEFWVGLHPILSQPWVGNIGPQWVFSGTVPDAGQIAQIIAGADPRDVGTGATCVAYYRMDGDDGIASLGGPDLQMFGQPTPLSHIMLVRDQGPNEWNLGQAFGSPYEVPIWHPSPARGIFVKSPFTHLARIGTIGTIAPPFQVYAAAGAHDDTTKHAIFSLAQNSGAGQNWVLQMRGDVGGNPVRWKIAGGEVDTSVGFEPFTTYLMWALEGSAISHAVRLEDANEGASTDPLAPAAVTNLGVGQEFGIGTNDCMDGFVRAIWTLNTASLVTRPQHVAWAQRTFDVPGDGSTELPSIAVPTDDPAVMAWWDFTDPSSLIVGGFSMDGVDDYFDVASVPSGVNSYPLWVVAYVQVGADATLLTFHDGDSSDEKGIRIEDEIPRIYSRSGMDYEEAEASAVDTHRWVPIIGIWDSPSSMRIITPTGRGSNVNTVTPAGLAATSVGRHPSGNQYWGPSSRALGPIWVFTGPPPGQLQENRILRGEDPILSRPVGATCVAHWPMHVDGDASVGPSLTVHSAPAALNQIIIARDKGRNRWHLQQYDSLNTSKCPRWDGSKAVLSGSFVSGSFEYLEHRGPMGFKAPFQVFAVATIDNLTAKGCVFSVVGNANGVWTLQTKGDVGGDPVRWFVDIGGGGQTAEAATANGFAEDTPQLLWALEAEANSRIVQLNGDAGNQGNDATSIVPGTAYQLDVGVTGGPPVGESETDWFPGAVYGIWLLDTKNVTNKPVHEAYSSDQFGVP